MSQLVITTCSKIHAPIISALHEVCFERNWSKVAVEKTFSMPGVAAFLGSSGDEPHSFVLGRKAADEAEIITIGVSPSWRRKGIAVLLLDAFLKTVTAQGAMFAYLEVAEDNHPAHSLYTSLQFQKVGRRINYYKCNNSRVDALVLRKVL